jgi:deoxyribonuclease V
MHKTTILTVPEAVSIQKKLAEKVICDNQYEKVDFIAGADISNNPFNPESPLYAAIIVLSYPDLNIVEQKFYSEVVSFPYIPGLLAFREAPVIIKALEKLENKPDIIIADGHGIAHPRRLGIASHIGVLTGCPSIGCAKSLLVGKPESSLPLQKGSFVNLIWQKQIIGRVLRTKNNVKPVYVSSGHKIALETASEIVFNCTKNYRVPEPLRLAHNYANFVRKNAV